MIQAILKDLGDIQNFGIISMCLFCAVFAGVLLWAFLQKKSHLDYMAQVALDQDQEQTQRKSHE